MQKIFLLSIAGGSRIARRYLFELLPRLLSLSYVQRALFLLDATHRWYHRIAQMSKVFSQRWTQNRTISWFAYGAQHSTESFSRLISGYVSTCESGSACEIHRLLVRKSICNIEHAIIYSPTSWQHLLDVEIVLERLGIVVISLNLRSSFFLRTLLKSSHIFELIRLKKNKRH